MILDFELDNPSSTPARKVSARKLLIVGRITYLALCAKDLRFLPEKENMNPC
jgi:hypothetical protein